MGIEEDREMLLSKLIGEGALKTDKIIEAFREVQRELFVPQDQAMFAYKDYPIEIGGGQTISAPHMSAVMTELLRPAKKDRVLEIGSGSGYQACILSKLASMVVTMEVDPDLAVLAENNLRKAGCTNAHVLIGDGSRGFPQYAPYDRIIVTCAVPDVPKSLKEQLKDGGVIVAPVGGFYRQELTTVRRHGDSFNEEIHGACIFVPLRSV